MARAYKKTYLNGAMRNLAVMMDCGVRKYGYTIGEFYQKFLSSGVSRQFGQGNPRYLVGMSGAELADLVVQESGGSISDKNDGTYTGSFQMPTKGSVLEIDSEPDEFDQD